MAQQKLRSAVKTHENAREAQALRVTALAFRSLSSAKVALAEVPRPRSFAEQQNLERSYSPRSMAGADHVCGRVACAVLLREPLVVLPLLRGVCEWPVYIKIIFFSHAHTALVVYYYCRLPRFTPLRSRRQLTFLCPCMHTFMLPPLFSPKMG